MSGPVFVVSTGARTPLGLDTDTSAAAVRAAISSCSEHPFMVDQVGEPMPASMDALLDPATPCRERMLAMGQAALLETSQPLTNINLGALPLLLGLPEPRPGFGESDAHWLSQQISQHPELPVSISKSQAYMSGNSAVLSLFDMARQEMAQGQYEACLIGGIESYFHADTMEWLDTNKQLLGSVSRAGFVPAEGAGFCLVMTPTAAQQAGLRPIALIHNTATAWESKLIKTQEMNFGEALIESVRATVAGLDASRDRIHSIYCDINGERYRGEEWGFTCLKLAQYFDDPTGYWSPADCWGDMGAASGALFVGLATQAALRGYASGKRSLLWTSSENGLRTAALLEADVIPSPYRG